MKYPIPLKVVNLDRRPDRWATVQSEFDKHDLDIQRVSAVDGKDLVFEREIQFLFRNNDFQYRRGIIGCAMTHMQLWRELVDDVTHDQYIIFEDDITLCNNFVQRLNETISQSYDFLFLGYFIYPHIPRQPYDLVENDSRSSTIINMEDRNYLGGTWAYIITKKAAQILLEIIDRNGMQEAVDRFLQTQFPILRQKGCIVGQVVPQIVKSEYVTAYNAVDSDIQRDLHPILGYQ